MEQVTHSLKSEVLALKGNVMAHSLRDLFQLDPRLILVGAAVLERVLLAVEDPLEGLAHPTKISKT